MLLSPGWKLLSLHSWLPPQGCVYPGWSRPKEVDYLLSNSIPALLFLFICLTVILVCSLKNQIGKENKEPCTLGNFQWFTTQMSPDPSPDLNCCLQVAPVPACLLWLITCYHICRKTQIHFCLAEAHRCQGEEREN